jgi:arylsulfatase A
VHHADLLATLAEIWDVRLPGDAGEDSFSIVPLLRGQDQPIRSHAVNTACNGVPSVRMGKWKLILAPDPAANTEVQLYNLEADLGETKNLAADDPALVDEMRALLEKLIVAGRSTPGAAQKNDVRVRRYPLADGAAAKPGAKAKRVK